MILAKGEKVIFAMTEGRPVRLPPSYAILHDVEGERFPKCSILLGPTRRTQRLVEPRGAAKDYFGKGYDLKLISVPRLPTMESFRPIGRVTQIDYVRRGKYKGLYYHPFKRGTHPVLSKSGRWFKLELESGCIYDDRGIVFP